MENGHVQTLLRLQDGNKTDLASPDYKAIPLPPLIKIANTVPAVGYSATTNTNQNNSEPSSSVTPIHLVRHHNPVKIVFLQNLNP
jgi:hypothetical protein